jgi:hypothetical protein
MVKGREMGGSLFVLHLHGDVRKRPKPLEQH